MINNHSVKSDGHEEYVTNYNGMVGMMIRSVTAIFNMTSYILIKFVSTSF